MRKAAAALSVVLCCLVATHADDSAPPPRALVEEWKLSPRYEKYADVGGLPLLGSAKVSPYALREAAWLIRQMIGHRPELLRALADNRVRFVVMAASEMTTDVPEHADLEPKSYWDRRARGLGATEARPAVSCGEENLLELPGDPYAAENVLVHEFAHAIHERGMCFVDPSFDRRLQAAYEHARAAGLWKGTYALQNHREYWAEAAQSWFACNRADDEDHGPVDTREELVAYDPAVAKLLAEVFGDRPWRYAKPSRRASADRAHLVGFDPAKAGRFDWPERAPPFEQQGTPLAWLDAAKTPASSPRAPSKSASILFVNHRSDTVTLDWLDFDGKRVRYDEVRPGSHWLESTFAGHVWIVSAGEKTLGTVAAGEGYGRVDVR